MRRVSRRTMLYAEPTLAPALRRVGHAFTEKFGPGVSVLTAPPTLLLEQIQHNAAHDVLIVPAATMDEAQARGFVTAASRKNAWTNAFVIAAAAGAAKTDLATLFAAGPIAVTDATVAAAFDGHALLATLGAPPPARIIGVANTRDAADLLLAGGARSALLYLTDVRARPGLSVAVALEKTPPAAFAFAMNPHPPSKNAQAFVDFLTTPQAVALLHGAGLEISV
jgi:ABC-type molybdate transport system substrate-binding protein